MIDPDSRHGRELKAAEEFFALARSTPSPFMRSYYQRVAERYLSSEGELRTGHFPGLPAALGSATSPPHEPPFPAPAAAEPASESAAVIPSTEPGSITSPPDEPPFSALAAAEPASESAMVPAAAGSITSPPAWKNLFAGLRGRKPTLRLARRDAGQRRETVSNLCGY